MLWPETGTTKAELIEYYVAVAPALLRHLEGRPLTPRRFPDGVGGIRSDRDPGPPAGLAEAAQVALALRPRVEELGLVPLPKTSGSLGLHVHAAVEAGTETKRLAREVAEALAEERPDEVVAEMKRSARAGRVFVDWLQNDVTRQTVAPHSLHGLPHSTVAAPVRWDEVEQAAAGDAGALVFTPGDVLERVEREGDLFAASLPGA